MASDDRPTRPLAGAVEKGSEAATELIKAARDLGGSIGPAFQQMIGMAEDQIVVWRAMRRARLSRRFGDFMRRHGLESATREVAPAFLLPLIERAGIEADDGLQDVWAAMLANAADANAAIKKKWAPRSSRCWGR